MSPAQKLAEALARQTDHASVAKRAGVNLVAMANALRGRRIDAVSHLRLAAAIGFNPCPDLLADVPAPADFNFAFFGMGFYLRRGLNRHSHGQAAEIIGVAPQSVCRLERGERMAISVVLRGCTYIGLSPFGYFTMQNVLSPANVNVSRETSPA